MSDPDILGLHRALVGIRSLSHEEGEIADFVERFFADTGIAVRRVGNNVIARAGQGVPVLFNSHLDTVPAGAGWTRHPHDTEGAQGGGQKKVYGLGSNDAKASVAAMMACLLSVADTGGPCELTLTLVQEEETGGEGTEKVWPMLRAEGFQPFGVVVGEPTGLQVGIAQKGLLVVELIARGEACHAANATAKGAKNAVWELAESISALKNVDLGPIHPDLGPTTLQPTMLDAAKAHNQVPAEAKCVVDMRTVPGRTHAAHVEAISRAVSCEVRARSTRLEPYACPADAKIVAAALAANRNAKTFASSTMSDQVFFQGVEAIKCGPGESARSHTADEFVLEEEILAGARFYCDLLLEVSRAAVG